MPWRAIPVVHRSRPNVMDVLFQFELRNQQGVDVLPLEGERVNIGRSAAENHIVLADDSKVSRVHAAVLAGVSGWAIKDRGSRNGTFVNGDLVRGERLLRNGDEVTIGTKRLIFRVLTAESSIEATATTTLDPSIVPIMQTRDLVGSVVPHRGYATRATGVSSAPGESDNNPSETNSFRHEGEFWSLGFAGRIVRVRDCKGLRDLASLVGAQGTEIAAIELVQTEAATGRRQGAALAEPGFGVEADAGPVLDAQARQEYVNRLRELDEEFAEADENNDPVRRSLIVEEREFLVAALREAVGLGGRARRVNDPTERARKAVTARIRDAIDRIEQSHAELGRHLRVSVRTGAFCVYYPAEHTRWQLDDARATISRV